MLSNQKPSLVLSRAIVVALFCLALLSIGCASSGAGGGAAAVPPIVGTWNLELDTPMGKQEPTFTVVQTGGALSGEFSGQQGAVAVPMITDTDGQIAFDMNIEAAGQEIALKFTGTVDGDSLTGSFASDFGDLPVTGTRAP